MTDWIDAGAVMAQLAIRPQTLYAYVSRGRIEARPQADDPRKSLYRASDVARLAARKVRGRKAGAVAEEAIAWGEPVLASAIATISAGKLYYRGQDAETLSETATLEDVATLLWDAPPGSAALARTQRAALTPRAATGRSRAFLALADRAGNDPSARGRSLEALRGDAGSLLSLMTDAAAGGLPREGPCHLRLARAWDCDDEGADLIRRALVLLADHELNASTFAARVAASTGASLAASALAGLSALSGPLHGGMAARVQAFMNEAERRGPEAAVADRLQQGLAVPGFDHILYPDGDPRARALLAAFALPPEYEAVLEAAVTATGQSPNIDFALTALAFTLDIPDEAPFLIFAAARCAGWLAHALEQRQTGHLIRPRARYVGLPVGAPDVGNPS